MAAAPDQISGATRFTAIFGHPVAHSLSPAMHNAAYQAALLDRRYLAFDVAPAHLAAALAALPALGILGVNLTVPHKEQAAQILPELSEEARLLGAVNCVANRDGALYGDNTDARGLQAAFTAERIILADRRVIIIGAGGAAASASLAALRLGAVDIVICNRTVARAARLAQRIANTAPAIAVRARVTAHPLDSLRDPVIVSRTALVINATSLGLEAADFVPLDYAATDADCIFTDLIYSREPTPFLKPAGLRGRRILDGAGMLIAQAELAYQLFNAAQPPAGVMRAALMSALGRTS